MSSAFKVVDLKWWNKPVPLMKRHESRGFYQIGYLWNQRVYMVNNMNHGWIAFLEDQTEENLYRWVCPHCNASLWGSVRRKMEEQFKYEMKREGGAS